MWALFAAALLTTLRKMLPLAVAKEPSPALQRGLIYTETGVAMNGHVSNSLKRCLTEGQ